MCSSLKVFLLALVLAPCVNGQQNSVLIVKNNHGGFDKQYKRIFNAFRKADEQELKLRFNDFVIPVHWFTDTFGSDAGPALSERYSLEFEKFIYSTTNLFESVDAAQLERWERIIGSTLTTPSHRPNRLRPLCGRCQLYSISRLNMGGPVSRVPWTPGEAGRSKIGVQKRGGEDRSFT